MRPIPSAVLIPLLFLTLGINLKSEIFLAAFGAFWPLLVQTMYGVRDVDPLLLDTGRSFGVGRFERLYRITLPSAVPYIATGVRISSTVALILAFTAELFMGTPGLGQHDELRAVVRAQRPALRAGARHRLPRPRDPRRDDAARAPRAALAPVAAAGRRRDAPPPVDPRARARDRGPARAARRLAGLDGACERPALPAADDDPRRVPGPLALRPVRRARRPEPDPRRAGFAIAVVARRRDRAPARPLAPRARRSPCRTSSTGARCRRPRCSRSRSSC